MHLVTRGLKTYVYLSVREGKQVKKMYLGRGVCAQGLLALQGLRREQEALKAKREADEHAKLWPIATRMRLLRTEAKQVLEALYFAANYYKSRCRHYRPMKMDSTDNQTATNPGASLANEHADKAARDCQIKHLCNEIKAGKNHLRPQLRRLLLQERPEDIERISDLTRYVIDQWARQISPENFVMREAIAITANKERLALAPVGSSYAERLVVDRLVCSRLQQAFHELRMTAIADEVDATGSKIANAMEKRLQVANRELREAAKHYEKAVQLKAEISPPRSNSNAAALKIFNPSSTEPKRKSA